MVRRRHLVGPLGWHLAILATFVFAVMLLFVADQRWLLVPGVAIVLGFLAGLWWLGGRIGQHQPFRNPDRFWLTLGAMGLLFGVGMIIPRAFYQSWRYRIGFMDSAWSFQAGMGLAYVVVVALLMMMVWTGWALLVRLRVDPGKIETLAALLIAVGAWSLALGAVIYRTDYTSRDILVTSLPAGVILLLGGTVALLVSDVARRSAQARAASKRT